MARPTGRQTTSTGSGGGVHRGSSLSGGGSSFHSTGGGGGGGRRSSGGGGCLTTVISAIAVLVVIIMSITGAFDDDEGGQVSENQSQSASQSSSGDSFSDIPAGFSGTENSGTLNTEVAAGSREKYTVLSGNGADTTTIMVYMCGTDLESRSGMATKDIQEMLSADLSDNINLLLYTGGCNRWRNNIISSDVNQIYQVKGGQLSLLENNMGNGAMVDPKNLTTFIKYGAKNFPANRYDLILWDHGGGSNAGYGYDEKYARQPGMNLSLLNDALKDGGVKFDFVGFDACLMATVETALVSAQYADYMIASEETEPGVGWYYTSWLNAYSKDPSMDTLHLGQSIIDSYTKACMETAPSQETTLSLIDLAEVQNTVPGALSAFAKDTSSMLRGDEIQTVTAARGETREFATSSKIDQVDLVNLARNIGSTEGEALSKVLLDAVKYNRTSRTMTNAYGISVFFPYRRVAYVDSMTDVYEEIGMDSDYTRCIREFAALETTSHSAAGQAYSGGGSLDLTGMLGALTGLSGGGGDLTGQLVSSVLGSMLTGGRSALPAEDELNESNTAFLSALEEMDADTVASAIERAAVPGDEFVWTKNGDGEKVLKISDATWEKIRMTELKMYYDDGEGLIDLGLDSPDTAFVFDDEGNLMAPSNRTWLCINGHVCAYYQLKNEEAKDEYYYMGRVPVLLNGDYADLIIVFDNEHKSGQVAGAVSAYRDGETETVAKNMTELVDGDEIQCICRGYDYEYHFEDNYELGEPFRVSGGMKSLKLSNEDVGDGKVYALFRFTDQFENHYATTAVEIPR